MNTHWLKLMIPNKVQENKIVLFENKVLQKFY